MTTNKKLMIKTGVWEKSEKIVKQRENWTLHQVAKELILHTLNWLYLCLDSKKNTVLTL